jgi:hypothetical protein
MPISYKPTTTDTLAFRKLNKVCVDLEAKIKHEVLDINKSLLNRVKGNDCFLTDFCVQVEVRFLLSETHHLWKIDQHNTIGSVRFFGNVFPPYMDSSDLNQLASGKDYNEFKNQKWYPLSKEHHCFIIFKLMRELGTATIDQVFHTGTVAIDITVRHQHVKELKGKPFVSERKKWPDFKIDGQVKKTRKGAYRRGPE